MIKNLYIKFTFNLTILLTIIFFYNFLNAEEISLKLKTFAHTEFASEKFSSIKKINQKIKNKIDLFERGHKYEVIKLDDIFPKYLLRNIEKFKNFIEN